MTERTADLLLRGASVYCGKGLPEDYDFVAVKDNRIVDAGYEGQETELIGSRTRVITLDKFVALANENHVSVRLHACGEGAVRAALDAYESAARKTVHWKPRHQIEHIESVQPWDIPRFKALGVVASVQPQHIVSGIPTFGDNCYPEMLGSERDRYTWPFKSLLDSGAVLAGGSDAPVVKGNPFYGMYCGIKREHPDGTPPGGWNPKEKLTIQELLHAYTWGAAYAEHREH